MRIDPILCPFFVIAVGLPAQSTIVVGPSGLPQIRDAVALAAPGDVIVVEPGTYAHFTATVGGSIRALVPGTVEVVYDTAFTTVGCQGNPNCTDGPTRLSPPAGQELHVVGLRFRPTEVQFFPFPQVHHRVEVTSGRVTFEQCELRARNATVLRVDNAAVHLQDCSVEGDGGVSSTLTNPGLVASAADITAVDCTFAGNLLQGGVQNPSEGMRLNASVLHGSNLTITGGRSTIGAPALRAVDSTVWLSDSTLTGALAACAVENTNSSVALDRCTLVASNPACPAMPPSMSLLGVTRPQPLQNGAVFSLDFTTEPNGFVAVFASPSLATLPLPGLFEQPVWLDVGGLFDLGIVLADGNGDATASWSMPAGLYIGDTVWLQAASGFGFPLQLSPVVGGTVR